MDGAQREKTAQLADGASADDDGAGTGRQVSRPPSVRRPGTGTGPAGPGLAPGAKRAPELSKDPMFEKTPYQCEVPGFFVRIKNHYTTIGII